MSDKNLTLNDLKERFYFFSQQRSWEKRYTPDTLAKSITIEASELLEHFQWISNKDSWARLEDGLEKQRISHEIVDILYYLLMLVHILDIDVDSATKEKLEDLKQRYPAPE